MHMRRIFFPSLVVAALASPIFVLQALGQEIQISEPGMEEAREKSAEIITEMVVRNVTDGTEAADTPPATPPAPAKSSAEAMRVEEMSLDWHIPDFSREEPSAAAMEFDSNYYFALQSYRSRKHAKIAHAWRHYVTHYRDHADRGTIMFRYYVNAEGHVSLLQQLRGEPEKLTSILAIRAIIEINNNPEPLPDVLRERLPVGFFHGAALRVR